MGLDSGKDPAHFEILTPLWKQMRICQWLGIAHADFMRLPRDEKTKWLCYEEMERRRTEFFENKQMQEMKAQQAMRQEKAMSQMGGIRG